MQLISLFLLSAAGLASAESTVTSMLLYFADPQPLAASIIGNDATATTYSINCPPGTDGTDCGMGPGLTVIAGESRTTYEMVAGTAFYWSATCDVDGTKSAVCTETAGGPEANFPGVDTSTVDYVLMPVTVTAGSVTSVDATTTASSTKSAAAPTATLTTSSTASTETPSPSSSVSGPGTTPSSSIHTGGVAQVTGQAGMMLGGAAIAMAAALL